MNLLHIYKQVDNILNRLNFNNLFYQFKKYKFALYTSKEICFNGDIMPYDKKFIGNTSIDYNKEYIAIWNYELDRVEDIEVLAYLIVHEMFHCFQNENKYNKFPNDFILFNYPNEYENFNIKYTENTLLADAYVNNDKKLFHTFIVLRNKRLTNHKTFVVQELLTEQLEGLAEYVGLKALKSINFSKYIDKVHTYILFLKEKTNLLFNIRKISYYSGALFWLCLDSFDYSFVHLFDLNHTYFEDLIYQEEEIIVNHNEDIKEILIQSIEEKQTIIDNYIGCSTYFNCVGKIVGYDPMNTFGYEKYLYCRYFIIISKKDKNYPIYSEIVLVLKENSLNEIKGYYLK